MLHKLLLCSVLLLGVVASYAGEDRSYRSRPRPKKTSFGTPTGNARPKRPPPKLSNHTRRSLTTSIDPMISEQWSFMMDQYRIKAYGGGVDDAWKESTGSSAVVVAIAGTGIDVEHEDLRDNLFYNYYKGGDCDFDGTDSDNNGYVDDCNGWNFVDNNYNITDWDGSSTAEAGIIGAVGGNGYGISGVSWNVRLLPLKICDSKENPPDQDGVVTYSLTCKESDLIQAINYAINFGVRVFHFGFGSLQDSPSSDVQKAVKIAQDAYKKNGMIIVTNAGDDGVDVNPVSNAGDNGVDKTDTILMQYPASYQGTNIISVASHGSTGKLSSFSNWGSSTISTSAPGERIFSTAPSDGNAGNYDYVDGTQYAAAHVSGALALLLSKQPTSSATELIHLLKYSGQPLVATSTVKLAWKKALDVHSLMKHAFSQSPVFTWEDGTLCDPPSSSLFDSSRIGCRDYWFAPTWNNKRNEISSGACDSTFGCPTTASGVQTFCVKLSGDDLRGCFCPPDYEQINNECIPINQEERRSKDYWCQSTFSVIPGYVMDEAGASQPSSSLVDATVSTDPDVSKCATSEYYLQCPDAGRGYTCDCPSGFASDTTAALYEVSACQDMNECTLNTNDCDASSICVNSLGYFQCKCPKGYWSSTSVNPFCVGENGVANPTDRVQTNQACWADVGPAACEDINECNAGMSRCAKTTSNCINSPGSWYCQCKTGFYSINDVSSTAAVQCKDYNECINDPQICGAWTAPVALNDRKVCINTFGSYTCGCPTGMYRNGPKCLTAYTKFDTCNAVTNNCDVNVYGPSSCGVVAVVGGGSRFACKCKTGAKVDDVNPANIGKCACTLPKVYDPNTGLCVVP